MKIATFVKQEDQRNWFEGLAQAIQANLSDSGFVIPSVTRAQLMTDTVTDVNGNTYEGLRDLMPVGTIWFVTDTKVYVGKIEQPLSPAHGVLVEFLTQPYV